jgi:hypothetical protein
MTTAGVIHQAARKFEEQPGCGCAKKRARMNAIIPGSGDAVAAVASRVAKTLHEVANAIDPEGGVMDEKHIHYFLGVDEFMMLVLAYRRPDGSVIMTSDQVDGLRKKIADAKAAVEAELRRQSELSR